MFPRTQQNQLVHEGLGVGNARRMVGHVKPLSPNRTRAGVGGPKHQGKKHLCSEGELRLSGFGHREGGRHK